MEAKKYHIEIDFGTQDDPSLITEIYIPQIGLCINSMSQVIQSEGPRVNEYEEIDIDYEDVITIHKYYMVRLEKGEVVSKLFN
jgi:hypothetical protein